MTKREKLRKRIGKLERTIGRTERVQATRRALLKRLLDPATPVAELHGLVEFHLDVPIDYERSRADKTGRAPLETSTVSGSRSPRPTRRAAPARERIKRA